jgi:membrane-associated protease RseP (regulator of RpoE activity)
MKTDDDMRDGGEPPTYPQRSGGFKGFLASRGTTTGDDVPAPDRRISLWLLIGFVVLIGLLGGWSTLFVILAIIVMVFLHELGHYVTAKAAGMKVTEFFIGFGPKIWSFKRGETEYGLKAIPAGAYVRIIGMHNLEEVAPEDEPRTYRQKPFWRRLSVAVAGSTMHFIIALVCIWSILVFAGAPKDGRLFQEAKESPNWVIDEITAGSAAATAGLQVGDKIVSFDGERHALFSELRPLIQESPGKTVHLGVLRNGQDLTLTATIGQDEWHGFLGVRTKGPDVVIEKRNPVLAVPQSFLEFGTATVESLKALGGRFSPAGISDFASQVADGGDTKGPVVGNGTSGGSSGSASSPENKDRFISIVGAVGIGAELTRQGWVSFVFFLALINIFIGLFNLVPLLPLDGGHVAIAVYEKIRSMLRGGKPYHADVAKLLPLTYAVVLVLVFVGVSSLYLDIVNPIHLN